MTSRLLFGRAFRLLLLFRLGLLRLAHVEGLSNARAVGLPFDPIVPNGVLEGARQAILDVKATDTERQRYRS